MAAAKHLVDPVDGPTCCETTGESLIPVDIALTTDTAKTALLAAPLPCSNQTL